MSESELREIGDSVLFVLRGGEWYVRRVASVTHDQIRDEKIYYCDQHLGRADTFEQAALAALATIQATPTQP